MIERVEEYRYISSSVGDLRDLPIRIVSLRVGMFQKVHKRFNPPAAPGGTPRTGRRLR